MRGTGSDTRHREFTLHYRGLAELRNKVGAGHGHESVPTWVQPRHARLASGAARSGASLCSKHLRNESGTDVCAVGKVTTHPPPPHRVVGFEPLMKTPPETQVQRISRVTSELGVGLEAIATLATPTTT